MNNCKQVNSSMASPQPMSTGNAIPRSSRNRRNEIAILLRSGPGILQRAQKTDRTLGGLTITAGTITKLLTMAEQADKATDPRTPDKIRTLLMDPYHQISVITEHLGLTGVGGLVVERLRIFNFPITCIICATWESPLVKLNGMDSYRVPV